MQIESFRAYLAEREFTPASVRTFVAAVARIERCYGVDIDDEYDRDRLARILSELVYTVADRNSRRPNPSCLDVQRGALIDILPPYRSHLLNYVKFRQAVPRAAR